MAPTATPSRNAGMGEWLRSMTALSCCVTLLTAMTLYALVASALSPPLPHIERVALEDATAGARATIECMQATINGTGADRVCTGEAEGALHPLVVRLSVPSEWDDAMVARVISLSLLGVSIGLCVVLGACIRYRTCLRGCWLSWCNPVRCLPHQPGNDTTESFSVAWHDADTMAQLLGGGDKIRIDGGDSDEYDDDDDILLTANDRHGERWACRGCGRTSRPKARS